MIRFASILIAGAMIAHAIAAPDPFARSIRIGLDGPDTDACPSVGRVTGTNPRGDHFLNVRGGPSIKAAIRDRLKHDASLIVCDGTKDGKWLGVIYGENDILGVEHGDASEEKPDRDCHISSPVKRPRAYPGPCKSGWVSSKFVEIVAG